uniref:Secretory carrier-associated membrane protein n=1 Tax=Pelodiscus sinensis TaxID=13735 RepID=K7FT48_PELSI
PFQDPAVMQHQPSTDYATLDVYNPFDNRGPTKLMPGWCPAPQPVPRLALLLVSCSGRSSAHSPRATYSRPGPSLLLPPEKPQTEQCPYLIILFCLRASCVLLSSAVRQNNWPPLPSFCPVKPCFYQDISVEIPADFQKTVSSMYYLWMASTVTLFLNFLASLAWFCVDSTAGSGFGLSILWVLLFTPCSFLCWYRPMYKAFRSDSSFNFFVFFFIFFVQDVVYVLQAIGIPGSGFSGWIASLTVLRSNQAAAAIMLLVAVFFTVVAVLGIFMLKRIHSLYRRTGASFQKAQEEVAAGVFSNQAGRMLVAAAGGDAAPNSQLRP